MPVVDDHPRECEGGWDGLSDCEDVEGDSDCEGRVPIRRHVSVYALISLGLAPETAMRLPESPYVKPNGNV